MKLKKAFFLFGLLVLAGLSVHAQQGGYVGPGTSAVTVAEAKTLWDDSPVVLQGKIERALGRDTYVFSDETGSVIIEIRRSVWGNLTVGENDMVEITGKIEGAFRWIIIEVSSIRKI
jgi:uncharacterized protein (TIGR00156 family)